VKERAVLAFLGLAAGFLVYRIPLVRNLVWLNAAAIANEFGARWALVPFAVGAVLLLGVLFWAFFAKAVARWREKNDV